MDVYDNFYTQFRAKIAELDTRISSLQAAEDNYYTTAKYILELANRSHDLFIRSEVDEKRQLLKLILQNLRLEGKTLRYEAIKPFDTILHFSDCPTQYPLVDVFRNRVIEINCTSQYINSLKSFSVENSYNKVYERL